MRRKFQIFHIGLLLLVILAGSIRVIGLSWGLPQEFHPDEPLVVPRAVSAIIDGDWNPHYFLVPSLQTELTSAAYGIVYLGGMISGGFNEPSDFAEWAALNNTTLYLIGRSISVLFGLLTMIGSAFLAREVLSILGKNSASSLWIDLASLLAGSIVAISPLITASSRLITPDIPMLSFFVWSLWAIVSGMKRLSARHFILAALFAGLAISSKYSAGILLIPLIISMILVRSEKGKTDFRVPVLTVIAALVGGFLLGTPYSLLDINTFISHLVIQYSAQHTGHIGMDQAGLTFTRWGTDLITNEGYILAILSIAGMFLLWRKQRKVCLVIVPLLLLYLFELSRWTVYADRYLLPALPLMALLASITCFHIAQSIRAGAAKYAVAIFLCVAMLIPPAIVNARMTSRLLLPDTRTIALEWIEENVPSGTTILWEIGGPQPADGNKKFHREPSYDIVTLAPRFSKSFEGEDPAVTLVRSNAEYVITSSNYRYRYEDPYTRKKYPEIADAWSDYYAMLDDKGVIAYEIRPGENTVYGVVVGPGIVIYTR